MRITGPTWLSTLLAVLLRVLRLEGDRLACSTERGQQEAREKMKRAPAPRFTAVQKRLGVIYPM